MPGIPPGRYAYLGPEGTFTETALRQLPAAARADLLPYPSVDSALDAVREGDADAAMVPIENSVEGAVSATLDALAVGDPLAIVREVLVPVSFVLAARPGTLWDDVRRVSTHPHAHAQCRGWLAANLPGSSYVPALSTAAAATGLAEADTGYDAALCAPIAAARYRLEVLAEDVADNPAAVTRFVLVGRPAAPPAPTGADKTSIVAFQPDDHPGGLLELLEQFAVRGVNLVRIESRPTGDALGRYCFAIDAEGHIGEARMAEALVGLHRFCSQVRFLGSYPSASAAATVVRTGTSDASFADARAWVERLRDGRS